MKKLILASLVCTIVIPAAQAATSTTPWWNQPTVCRISTVNCYTVMGAGYDPEEWDESGNCRGMKFICPEALKTGETEPTLMSKVDISSGRNINNDFDINALGFTNDCFGTRKTSANGTLASVDGQYINVWCRNILNDADEELPNGEITKGAQPTCQALAENGYAGIVNGQCYGKYYNPTEYYIECGAKLAPERLIIINGADIYAGASQYTPATKTAADEIFREMQAVSQAQRAIYFKNAD